MAISLLVSVAGLPLAAWAIVTARSTWKRAVAVRTRWVLIAREISVALIGVGVAIVPWARLVGVVIGVIGVMGRAYFGVWGLMLGGAKRRTP
jgi:hypothetical protein